MKLMFLLLSAAVLALAGCASLPSGLAGSYSASADAYGVLARRGDSPGFLWAILYLTYPK